MALIKKHWKGTLMYSVLVIMVTASVMLQFSGRGKVKAGSNVVSQPAPVAVDTATYTQVNALRNELALRNEDLAAMGCNGSGAQQILNNLLTWYRTNKPQLDQAENNILVAQSTLQGTIQMVHMGPRNESLISQVPALQQQVSAQVNQRALLLHGCTGQISSLLNSSQLQIWQTAQANLLAPMQYRYAVGLTSAQLQRLASALATAQPAMIQAAENQTLNGIQTVSMAMASANLDQNMPGVLAADATVLPVPSDMIGSDSPQQ